MSDRLAEGIKIFENHRIVVMGGTLNEENPTIYFKVETSNKNKLGKSTHRVTRHPYDIWHCDCRDNKFREGVICKHVFACIFFLYELRKEGQKKLV